MSHQDRGQCIHCDVASCEYHAREGKCSLNDIQVSPKPNCSSANADESVCASYRSRGK